MGRWICGALDLWGSGSMGQWICGAWIYGALDLWGSGSVGQWICGAVDLWGSGSVGQWIYGALDVCCPAGAVGPRVAVLREEGSNGDREMAAAFHMAGCEVMAGGTEIPEKS